jgi:hypothetical protein
MFTQIRTFQRTAALLGALACGLVLPRSASAQIDPLLFLKPTQPNVIIAVDLANRMQRDAPTDDATVSTAISTSNYYDPVLYPFSSTGVVNTGLGLTTSNTSAYYRRKFIGLVHDSNSVDDKFKTSRIDAVTDGNVNGTTGSFHSYQLFEAPTRLAIARAALDQAIRLNQQVARFGLVRMRQNNAKLPTANNEYSNVLNDSLTPTSNCGGLSPNCPVQDVGDRVGTGKWYAGRPLVGSKNGSVSTASTSNVTPGASSASTVLGVLAKDPRQSGALLPAGADDGNTVDTPVKYMLDDAKELAKSVIDADVSAAMCRNTVVVLIAGGGEGNTVTGADPATVASTFTHVNRKIPIYVIAIAPPAADRAQLQNIATNSGGQYFEVTKAMIDAALAAPGYALAANQAPPTGTVVVPEMVAALNKAIQQAFSEFSTFAVDPAGSLSSEFQTTSPIVGTVNLEGAKEITGTSTLQNDIVYDKQGAKIPQRSNVMLTTSFTLPGFDGQLRAFRAYKPVTSATATSGYKFENDGTRLWVADVPAADSRNIYTVLPTGTTVEFTTANAAALAPYLNVTEAEAVTLITYVRSQKLGAFVGSTPAVMDAPSVDPPPDSDYPGFRVKHENRRTVIWVGANDGMIHGIDGRLGKEVVAMIPSNLLPKLKELRYGQSVGIFNYFADGSAKVADVRVSGPCAVGETSCWRTYLFFGEGPGGTFYQAFDVTLDGMASAVSATSDDLDLVLDYFADAPRMTYKWSFPDYSYFDYTLAPWGDIKTTAPALEKTVGQSWADPAVGQIESSTGKFAIVFGSGFLPYSTQTKANRAGIVAGTTFYVLSVENAEVFDSVAVTTDGKAETVDDCAAANDCTKIKNALQADPVATGPPNSRFITMVYNGDLDGRVWRFDLGMNTTTSKPYIKTKPGTKLWDGGEKHPIFSSMATVNVVSTQQYIFFGTGSDLLPSNNVSDEYKLVAVLDNGGSGKETFAKLLTKVDGAGADEKVSAFPAVAGDIVFFTTTTLNPATPCTLPTAKLYALTYIGGPAYDTTGDSKVTSADSIVLATIAGMRATAPFVSDRHLIFGSGKQARIFGDPEGYNNGVGQAGIRILSWRELR